MKLIPHWLVKYQKKDLKGDIIAGITVSILLVPQGMAYAMIAGLPAVYGLYAAIVPQIIYALFGTSGQINVGPVAMDSILVMASLSVLAQLGSTHYINLAILLALMVGTIQLFLGIARLGFIVNFLSKPVISGFTTAAAIIIGANQLKHLLGIPSSANSLLKIIRDLFTNYTSINSYTLTIGIIGILLLLVFKKYFPKFPNALLLVVFGSTLVYLFGLQNKGVAIIGTIPEGMPSFELVSLQLQEIQLLLPSAITLAFIGFMETYSIGKGIQDQQKSSTKIVPNQEMVALGLSNVLGSFFGAYPSTASFSRSVVNEQSGANTGLASIISALLIILTLLFLTPLFYYLPKATLGAIILVSVIKLIKTNYPQLLFKIQKQDFIMWVTTFVFTLLFGIREGISTGVILSIGLLIYRTTKPHYAVLAKIKNAKEYRNILRFEKTDVRKDVLILRYDSQLYFANSAHFSESVLSEAAKYKGELKLVILHGDSISFIDSTALEELQHLIVKLNNQNIVVYFTALIGPVRDFLTRSGFIRAHGARCFFTDIQDALDYFDKKPNRVQQSTFSIATQSNVI